VNPHAVGVELKYLVVNPHAVGVELKYLVGVELKIFTIA
jgi:hypothetical protein